MKTLPTDLLLFEGRRTRPAGSPAVGIQRRGNLSLNASAFALLGEPEAVHFYFSASANVIAIKAVSKETPLSFPVRKQAAARSYLIGARSFLTQNGIPFDTQKDVPVFSLELVEGMGVISLSEYPAMIPDGAQE